VVSQTYASMELPLLTASLVVEPESKSGPRATGSRSDRRNLAVMRRT
jgi:hypothetical protein